MWVPRAKRDPGGNGWAGESIFQQHFRVALVASRAMRFPSFSPVLLLALFTGCAASTPAVRPEPAPAEKPAPPAPPPPAEAKPMTLQEALAREFDALPIKEVTFPADTFRGQAETSGQPEVTPHEGFLQVSIPVGTAVNMECFVYPKHLDSGAALLGFIQSVTEGVQLVQLRPVEIAAVGVDAVVVAHANYVTETPAGKQGGVLKIAVRAKSGNSVLCYHDEPGFSKSFSRMVQTFAGSLEAVDTEEVPSLYSELQRVSFRDVPVGFERRRVLTGKDGGKVHEVISMMLMPRSAVDLLAEDSSHVTTTDSKGRVVSIRSAEGSSGEATVDLTVERTSKNVYAYQGALSGKEVSGTFKSKDKAGLPGDELVEARLRDQLFDGKTKSLAFESYDPALDLNAPTQLTITPLNAAERTAQVAMGAIKIDGQVDANGRLSKANINLGPAVLTMERIAEAGQP